MKNRITESLGTVRERERERERELHFTKINKTNNIIDKKEDSDKSLKKTGFYCCLFLFDKLLNF